MRHFIRVTTYLAVALFLLASASAQNVYFGNLHSHTSYSDGTGKPEDAFQHARNVAGLDFLAVTEHNHKEADGSGALKDHILIATNPDLYNGADPQALIPSAARHTVDGKFVALFGQEFSTISTGNHVNVFDIPKVITVPKGEFKQLLSFLDANRDSEGEVPLIQFNHPALFSTASKEYGRHKFASTEEWVAAFDPHVKLIEVLNGPAMGEGTGQRAKAQEKDYLEYLNLGFHLAPSSGQDNHRATWGSITDARVAVLADNLTKKDILKALKNRRAYATEDKNLRIIFTANKELMGSIVTDLPATGSELDIRVSIKDDDEPNAHYRVEVLSDTPGGDVAKVAKVIEIEGDTAEPARINGVRFTGPGQYVLLKITQTSEHGESDRAWTAPVWFEAAGVPAAPAVGSIRIAELLPNPSGADDVNESVTLRNVGTSPISLAGWSLRDLSGAKWDLTAAGTIGGGQQRVVKRNGQPMSLNNGGDTIELINSTGQLVQTVSYGPSAEDQVVRP